MNTPPSDQPRLTCRLARSASATFGRHDGTAPRGLGSGHIARCADCQQFFATCDEFDLALTRDASRLEVDFPAGLESRIAQAVARSTRPEPVARPALPLFALLGAAACAAIALFVYQRGNAPVQPAAAKPDIVAVIDTTRDLIATHPLRTQVMDSLDSTADTLLKGKDPLSNEVQAIRSDARSALRFLALNFLPTPAEEPAPRRNSG